MRKALNKAKNHDFKCHQCKYSFKKMGTLNTHINTEYKHFLHKKCDIFLTPKAKLGKHIDQKHVNIKEKLNNGG